MRLSWCSRTRWRVKGEYVFVNSLGGPYKPDSPTGAFTRARNRAKLTDLRLHDRRHHFATMEGRAGADLDIVRPLLGHAHLSVTERYAHVGRSQLHAAVSDLGSDRIAQYSGGEVLAPDEN